MAITQSKLTLNTTTAVLLTGDYDNDFYQRNISVSVQNLHTTHFVYLGTADVSTSAYGFRIDPGQTWTSDMNGSEDLYAVCDTGTTDVAVMRIAR